MESQGSSTIWLPTFCNVGSAISLQESSPLNNKHLLQPVVTAQPIFLQPKSAGHLLVHMQQQVAPIFSQDITQQIDLQSCGDLVSQTVLFPPLQRVQSFHQSLTEPTFRQNVNNCEKLAKFQHRIISKSVNRTQRKKKISPSAKRRSRLRLIAFLESKKEKCASQFAASDYETSKNQATAGSRAEDTDEFNTLDLNEEHITDTDDDNFHNFEMHSNKADDSKNNKES
ncbi:uncharacterized protein LOC143452556 isoform X1 [Clavelina lepadiformis]|uniref:uncharacterized protein LOC143452556 isoform X1 n=1 Tax=Clavelina lepadiformis TaxID=159417 RepID=UPI004040F81F